MAGRVPARNLAVCEDMIMTASRSEVIDEILKPHKGRKRSPADAADEILQRIRCNGGYIDPAVTAAGVSRASFYRYRAANPEYDDQLQVALAEGVRVRLPMLEATAFQRATVGHAIPVYAPDHMWQDDDDAESGRLDPEKAMQLALTSRNIIGWKHVSPSDALLAKMLGAEDRDKYNPPKVNINVDSSKGNQQEVLRTAMKEACERRGIPFKDHLFDDAMIRLGNQGKKYELPVETAAVEPEEPEPDFLINADDN